MSVPSIFLSQLFTRKLFAFAGNSLLIHDYLLTLSFEVEYIWKAPWSFVKALFLINRYGNLFGQTVIMLEETGYLSYGSQKFCTAFQLYCPFFAVFSGESIRLLIVMRACAVLRFKRNIAVLLITLYAFYAIAILVLVYRFPMTSDSLQFEYLSETGVCIKQVPPNPWTFWLMPLFLDALVFIIVCCSLWRLTRGSRELYPLRLIRLLTRDALLFYLATLFNVLFSIVCWTVYSKTPKNFLQILITYPFLSVIGQRVILNLRRFGARPDLTHDLSNVVDRQIAAIADELSCRQSGRGLEGGRTWEGASSETIQMVDFRLDHEANRRDPGKVSCKTWS